MGPHFRFKSHTSDLGKYLVVNGDWPDPIALDCMEITHVLETCLSQMPAHVPSRDGPNFPIANLLDHASDGDEHATRKRTRKLQVSSHKKTKTAPSTITRRWEEVWACKFLWAEGEFNGDGDVISVFCWSYTTITGLRKLLVPKADNLEKHEAKCT